MEKVLRETITPKLRFRRRGSKKMVEAKGLDKNSPGASIKEKRDSCKKPTHKEIAVSRALKGFD